MRETFKGAIDDVGILASVLERDEVCAVVEVGEGNERGLLWGEHVDGGSVVLHSR